MNPPNPGKGKSRTLATLPQSQLCVWDLQRGILKLAQGVG